MSESRKPSTFSNYMAAIHRRIVARLSLLTITILLGTVSLACGSGTKHLSPPSLVENAVSPLRVVREPLPKLRLPHFETRGSYPRIVGGSGSLRKVNATLRSLVRDEQHRFAAFAKKRDARIP